MVLQGLWRQKRGWAREPREGEERSQETAGGEAEELLRE